MKKLLLLSIFYTGSIFAQTSIQTVATVGDIAITSYDIQQMRDFQQITTGKRPSANAALEQLIMMSSLLVLAENSPEYYMDEIEFRKTINNLTNNPSQPGAKQRADLYNKFPDIYGMNVKTDKVKRGMIFGDAHIKAAINTPITDKEKMNFYKQYKAELKDSPFPKMDLIIFAVEASSKLSLSQLSDIETQMANLATDLNTSSDFNAMRRKYSSLKFTKYSGRTGLFTPDILVQQKQIPEEILGLALQKSIPLGGEVIKIQPNKGIYIPQPIPLQSTGQATYLTFKILEIIAPRTLTYEEAVPKIEEAIRMQRAEVAIENYIRKQIQAGQITLTPTGNEYKSILQKFK